ncbi:MAG: type II CAAX prenyl endopeptidase Rce1 family protein [Bacteroidales bacterium]
MTIKYLNPANIKEQQLKFQDFIIFSLLLVYIYFIAGPIVSLVESYNIKAFSDIDLKELLAILIVAPLIEEISFRTHLSGEKKDVWGALLMFFVFFFFLKIWWGIVILLLFGGFIFLLYDEFTELICGKYYNLVFYISSLLFGLAHINVINSDSIIFKLLFIVTLYLPISLYFGYVRKKLGLAYAICAHSFYNFSALTLNSLL